MVGHREPYEPRGSRTVLGERGGEIPPRHSTRTDLFPNLKRLPLTPLITDINIGSDDFALKTSVSLTIKTFLNDDGDVEFSIHYVGLGMSSETLGKVFDSFFTSKNSGMGMVLSEPPTRLKAPSPPLTTEQNAQRVACR
jgi:hypothetical protein